MLSPSAFGKAILLRRAREEHGTTLVLMSLLLIALMGMAALVLDLGNARRVKRHAQGTGDSASLAAAMELTNLTLLPGPRMTNAANVARTYTERNLPAPPGGWTTSAWSSCADPSPLPIASGISPCISFDDATLPTKVRVKVPTQQVEAQFAGAIGQGAPVAVSAGATASLSLDSPIGGMVFPFGHGPKGGTNGWLFFGGLFEQRPPLVGLDRIYDDSNSLSGGCRTVDADSADACIIRSPRLDTSSGPLDPSLTTATPNALMVNIAMGIDHMLASYKSGDPRICDGSPLIGHCTITNQTGGGTANHVKTLRDSNWFGFSTSDWHRGLARGLGNGGTVGSAQYCGRLERPLLTSTNWSEATPGGCAPNIPTVNLFSGYPSGSGYRATVNGRHISFYMTDEARTAFYSPNGSCAYSNPPEFGDSAGNGTDPVYAAAGSVLGELFGAGTPDSYEYKIGDARLDDYLTTGTFSCGGPFSSWLNLWGQLFNAPPPSGPGTMPAVGNPIFKKEILLDPRFGWFPVITGNCPNVGLFSGNCFGGNFTGSFNSDWGKEIIEFRVAYIDWINEDYDHLLLADHYVDEVRAWTFDAALIEGGAPVGPIRISEGRGIPTVALSN